MKRKIRVLGLSANVIHGGATIMFDNLMNKLSESYVIFNKKIQNQLNSSNKNVNYFQLKGIRRDFFSILVFILFLPAAIIKLYKISRYSSLIIANDFLSLGYISFIRLVSSKSIIFYCHSAFKHTKFNKIIISRFVSIFSNIIVVPSNYLKQELVRIGVPENKIIVIYNGISLPINKVFRHKNEIIQIGIIGVVNYQKGQDIFAESLYSLKNQGYAVKGFIVGEVIDFIYFDKIKDSYADLIKNEELILINHLSHYETITLMEKLDIVVCLSRYMETLPTVLLEAMALNKAIIGTNIGGISEIINDRVNGILIEPNSSIAFTQAVKSIIDNNQLEYLGNNGFICYTEKFNESIYIDSFNKVLDLIIN